MADRDVSISLGEGLVIRPDADVSALAPDLDVMAELGAAQINTVSFERDRDRTFDQLALLTQLAAERGMGTTVEMAPGMVIGDLPTALAAIQRCGAQLQLCLDTMHWARSGYGAADIEALDPGVVGYVQLSDTTTGTATGQLPGGSDLRADAARGWGTSAAGDPGRCGARRRRRPRSPHARARRGGRQRHRSAATLRGRRAGVDVVNIAGKKAVVIGGASGLGRATAEALSARGADVAILDQTRRRRRAVLPGRGHRLRRDRSRSAAGGYGPRWPAHRGDDRRGRRDPGRPDVWR